jgi:ParB-like chromosome segregation protein Spo0J
MAKRNAFESLWPKMREETRPLAKIRPYPNNPRTHPPEQIALLAEVLKKFGPDQRIVIDGDDDFILKGHGRLESARLAGMRAFPVLIRYGLSAADKKAMRIQDNTLPLMSGWDAPPASRPRRCGPSG